MSKLGFLSTYLEDDNVFNKNAILEEIQYELTQVQNNLNATEHEATVTGTKKPPRKKTKFLVMACQGGASAGAGDGGADGGARQIWNAENEMLRYSKEPLLHHDSDVLQWW